MLDTSMEYITPLSVLVKTIFPLCYEKKKVDVQVCGEIIHCMISLLLVLFMDALCWQINLVYFHMWDKM